jgi:CRP/FNR family transcriptional regulator, cyclic AMP receptor protein
MSAVAEPQLSFLAQIPLFAGIPANELEEVARVMRVLRFEGGDVLFREGEEASGLHVLERGLVQASRRLPGGGELEYARLGPGDVLGEIPLLDGGLRSGTVQALEPTTALFLARADFTALVSRLHPTAFAIKRQILRRACSRLRVSHATLVELLGGGEPVGGEADGLREPVPEDFSEGGLPDPAYVLRLPFFRAYGESEFSELVRDCRLAVVPRGRSILEEGSAASACYVTLSGAVEEVIRRGGDSVRVRLCGPGRAFAYPSLIDGEPASVSSVTRERSLLLAVPAGRFDALFHGATISSYAFFNAVERDLMTALRQAQAPHARLAAAAR